MFARLNTMRLLNRSGWDYKFIIRDANTEAEVWSYNLMTLLSIARPVSRYDGTGTSFQEYLDRQSEWNLIFTVVENPRRIPSNWYCRGDLDSLAPRDGSLRMRKSYYISFIWHPPSFCSHVVEKLMWLMSCLPILPGRNLASTW